MTNLAEKLSALRKEKGLTQMELAEKLNVSRQAISRWEVGAAVPSTDNLKYLSTLYGVPVDYLLHDDAPEPNKAGEAPVQVSQESEQIPQEQDWIIIKKKSLTMFLCALLIVAATIIAVCAAFLAGQKQPHITPVEDMNCDTSYQPDTTFSFD